MLSSTVGYHSVTGQKVAMKFLSKNAIIASRTKVRVQREVDYMRTLRHPHIIKLSVVAFLFLFRMCILHLNAATK